MAISKEILNNKKKTIQPEPLGMIPTNNPDHRSAPIDMHHPFPQKPILYNSFEEAKDACGIIFLKPGEAHTEFYKSDKEYHCVVAIGNINPGYGHLYLTDSGSDMSIDDRLDNMNAGVNLYYKQVQILNTSVKNLNTSFIELNNQFNQFKIDVTGEIQSFITNVSAQIQDINDAVNANNSSTSNAINNFETYINGKIAEISAEVQTYNNRIATLESWQQIADTSLKVLNEKIQYESSVNNQQDVSINLLKQSTDNLQQQIIELSLNNTQLIDKNNQYIKSTFNEVNNHIDISVNEIDQHINVSINAVEEHINSSILSLQNLINEFEPISNPSIDSLFHDDIYTVNLCCYTAAGGVEIYDDVSGGYDLRVANCTAPNEYKTYVKGDDVSFKAVENEGYKFVCWYYGDGRGNINEVSVDPIINLEFTNSDIPVIGTLADGVNPAEPAILSFGYTAFFRKLHQVKWSFYQHTNVLNHPLAYFDDKLKITITDIDGNVSNYIVDKDYTRPIYFDDDSIVEIRAICSENGHHTFEGYTLNGSSEKLRDPLIIKNSAKDIVVCAEFKEWWILVQTDTEPRNMANIYSDGSDTYILHESRLRINVIDISTGWQFNKWTANGMDDATLQSYLDEGSLTDPNIVLHIDAFAEAGIYDLVAVLDTIQTNQ